MLSDGRCGCVVGEGAGEVGDGSGECDSDIEEERAECAGGTGSAGSAGSDGSDGDC